RRQGRDRSHRLPGLAGSSPGRGANLADKRKGGSRSNRPWHFLLDGPWRGRRSSSIGYPAFSTFRLLFTDFTPSVLRAIVIALSASLWLLTVPDIQTMPFWSVST